MEPTTYDLGPENPRAFTHATLGGFVALILLMILVAPHLPGTSSLKLGELAVPAFISAFVVGLIVKRSDRELGLLIVAPTVAVVGLALGAALHAKDLIDGADPLLPAFTTPPDGGGWARVDDADIRGEFDAAISALEEQADVDSVVGDVYSHSSHPEAIVLFAGFNGLGANLRGDPEAAADEALVGAGVQDPTSFDPGDAGGALGCGIAEVTDVEVTICFWVGNDRAMLMRWSPVIELEEGAQLTIDMRTRATRR